MAVPIAPSSTRTRSSNALRNAATRSAPMFPSPAAARPSHANGWPRPSPRLACKTFPTRRLFFLFRHRSCGEGVCWAGAPVGKVGQRGEEGEFLDRWAEENGKHPEPVDAAVLERYRTPGNVYSKEYCFRLLGDLRDKTILDVGCGEGEDGMILAKLGARVTGLDVSPAAIELARQRAQVNGVSERTRFVCAPLDAADLAEKSFDVIWIDQVLHHVLDNLEGTLQGLLKAAKPGALIVCSEPVNLNKTLRKIRFLAPVHPATTPGERPLEKADLAVRGALIPALGN